MSEAHVLFATERTRSEQDRRAGQRRAPRRPLDTLFAATLVNQVAPAEAVYVKGYDAKRPVRAGIALDLSA